MQDKNKMKFKTFSIIAGNAACNARCPYCVSKMTPKQGISMGEPKINWRNFEIGARLAKQSGIDTVMITGKGEPLLFPGQITDYLDALKRFEFPFIELQTNGILLSEQKEKYDQFLKDWYTKGLTIPSISIAHYDNEKNRKIFLPNKKQYPDLSELVSSLHGFGYSVRLACVLLDGFIDSSGELEKLVDFSRENKVEQLTIRPVNKPVYSLDNRVYDWVSKNYLKAEQEKEISQYLERKGEPILELAHGGIVYDVSGQNVCLTNSLTHNKDPDKTRQLIFFPDGHLRYDWEKEGAILL